MGTPTLFNTRQAGFKGKISNFTVFPGCRIFADLWYERRAANQEIHGQGEVQRQVLRFTHSLLKTEAKWGNTLVTPIPSSQERRASILTKNLGRPWLKLKGHFSPSLGKNMNPMGQRCRMIKNYEFVSWEWIRVFILLSLAKWRLRLGSINTLGWASGSQKSNSSWRTMLAQEQMSINWHE